VCGGGGEREEEGGWGGARGIGGHICDLELRRSRERAACLIEGSGFGV